MKPHPERVQYILVEGTNSRNVLQSDLHGDMQSVAEMTAPR